MKAKQTLEQAMAELDAMARRSGIIIPESSRPTVLMHLGIAERMVASLGTISPEQDDALALAPAFSPEGTRAGSSQGHRSE